MKFVEGVFGDLYNAISLPGGELPEEVSEDVLPHETVVIPASYCNGGA